MRPDVKLGVVVSLVVVLGVGCYFLLRGKREPSIPVAATPTVNSANTTIPVGKIDRTATAKPHVITPKTKSESVTIPPASRTADASPSGGHAPAAQPLVSSSAASPTSGTASTMNPAATNPIGAPTSTPGAASPTSLTSTNPNAAPNVGMSSNPAATPQTAQQTFAGGSVPGSAPTVSTTSPPATPGTQSAMQNSPAPVNTRSAPPASPFANQSTPVVSTTPSSVPPKTDNAATEIHRVQSGDSLASLARRYYGSERHVDHLLKANPQIKDPARLSIGMAVTIPAEPQFSTIAPGNGSKEQKPATLETKTASANKAGTNSRMYQVKQGDSFYGIARDLLGDANRWNEILALNREKVDGNPNRLRVGQVLVLPGT